MVKDQEEIVKLKNQLQSAKESYIEKRKSSDVTFHTKTLIEYNLYRNFNGYNTDEDVYKI